MADKLHPAATVTNIRQAIPITLDNDSGQYIASSTLFKLHARAHLVYDHIIPSHVDPKVSKTQPTSEDQALWKRLDAIVLQWIYGTISHDLLISILEPDDTTAMAWTKLADLFQDNKATRALHLENEFNNTYLRDFPNCTAYANRLKSIADQMANVGAKVDDERLTLRLIGGLTASYDTFLTVVQNMSPFPSFAKAKSMLLLDETNKRKLAAQETGSDSALLTQSNSSDSSHPNKQQSYDNSQRTYGNRGRRNSYRGRGGNNRNRGGGRGGHWPQQSGGQQQGGWNQQQRPPVPWSQQWSFPPWASWGQPWATPPCPYPTTSWKPRPNSKRGVLGPHPAQSFYTNSQSPSVTGYAPTDVEAAMHTLSLNPPDENWYMDTGASSHMTANGGLADREIPNEV